MLFNSLEFILVFLPLVLAGYFLAARLGFALALPPSDIMAGNHIRRIFGQQPETLFAFAQRLLGPFPFGDV